MCPVINSLWWSETTVRKYRSDFVIHLSDLKNYKSDFKF